MHTKTKEDRQFIKEVGDAAGILSSAAIDLQALLRRLEEDPEYTGDIVDRDNDPIENALDVLEYELGVVHELRADFRHRLPLQLM